MYGTIFGPVPSRRLGMSLGVDLVRHKVCTLDCMYCECGGTTLLTLERKEYVPVDTVFRELTDYFSRFPDPDFITFSGSGEPTLNSRIGEVIRFIKKTRPGVSVAVLTNGTLLHLEEVRQALLPADRVIPSLDAATLKAFNAINRPAPGIDLETHIQGLEDFRKVYPGKLMLEIFILPGVNAGQEDLEALARATRRIRPDLVQLNTLDRPGTETDIRAADRQTLEDAARYFTPFPVEIIASCAGAGNQRGAREDLEAAILETVLRRPCTAEDLASVLGTDTPSIKQQLIRMERDGKLTVTRLPRGVFYRAGHLPDA